MRAARKQGWEIITSGKHTRFVSPVTAKTIFTSSTPSDQKALKNIIADLRGEGFVWPPPGKKPSGR